MYYLRESTFHSPLDEEYLNLTNLKVGDRMPEPRGAATNYYSLFRQRNDPNLKGIIKIHYDSGDNALYLICRDETIEQAIIKRPSFGIYLLNDDGTKIYYLDNNPPFDDHIDSISFLGKDEIGKEFIDAPSCEGQI